MHLLVCARQQSGSVFFPHLPSTPEFPNRVGQYKTPPRAHHTNIGVHEQPCPYHRSVCPEKKKTLQPLSWAVSHFFDGFVLHRGSREVTNVQVHKRLGEQPGLVPDISQLPRVTLTPILLRDASRRTQQQPLMTHIFTSEQRVQPLSSDICSADTTPDADPTNSQYRNDQQSQQTQGTSPAAPHLKDPARLLTQFLQHCGTQKPRRSTSHSERHKKMGRHCKERPHVN